MLEATAGRPDQESVSPPALRSEPRDLDERAISPRLAPALTVAGGLLLALGGIGTWVRATSLQPGATTLTEVSDLTGSSESGGWILLVLGVITAASGRAGLSSSRRVRAIGPGVAVLAIVFASARLALIDSRAAQMAEEATSSTGIEAYHAGFGWGAWLMLAGAVALGLALLAGGLRELDLRRSSE
ncbi:MAG: hypothetical protein ACRDH9_09420 [Actinomycetota bacterium]